MSLSSLAVPPVAGPAPQASPLQSSALFSVPGLVLTGMALTLAFTLPSIRQILATGFYLDPDDAMRMAQAQDWMNGQGWFDLTSKRLDAPHGVFMHWTRLVDVPIGLLTWFFGLFTDHESAIRLMRIVLPMSLLAALFAVSIRLGRLLAGPAGGIAATVLTIMGGAMFGYFQPGRLDHDDVSILLLVVMTAALCRALAPGNLRSAFWAGLVIATGLGVSMETLPFAVVAIAVLPVAWIVQGAVHRAAMERFSWGLGLGLLAIFAAVVAPSHYLDGACDTLSAAHMIAGLSGSALCIALARGTGALRTVALRLGAAVAAGLVVVAAVKLSYPACLDDPYAGLDPVLRDVWLARVSEARPLWLSLHKRPALFFVLVLPILIGFGGTLWAAASERGVARARWLALAALSLAGIAAGIWQVRAMGEVSPVTLFGAAWIVARFTGKAFETGKAWAGPAMIALCLPMTAIGHGMVAPDDTTPAEAAGQKAEVACRTADAFTALAALPQGVILGPIDTGAHFLARTPHGVVAAPFHRNVHGNRLAIDAFMAAPAAAEAIVRRSGARYVVFCPHIDDIEMYREEAPQGLAVQLDDGMTPPWLKKLDVDSPYSVFELQ